MEAIRSQKLRRPKKDEGVDFLKKFLIKVVKDLKKPLSGLIRLQLWPEQDMMLPPQ